MTVQQQQIARVRSRIGDDVIAFARYIGEGTLFNIDGLRRWVEASRKTAPASPDRILRDLRQRGLLDYEVVDRSKALYKITRRPA